MHEDVAVDEDVSRIEEMLLVGAGTEVIAVALKGLEHGVIAEAKVAAEAVVGAGVGVGAGAEVEVVAEAGPVAVVEAIAVARDGAGAGAVTVVAAPAMTDMRVLGNGSLIKRILHLQWQTLGRLLNQGCLLCPQVRKAMHFQKHSLWSRYL